MAKKSSKKVRVAVIGVGNCASSLIQGVEFYKNAKETDRLPGLMHVNLGGYHIRDIEFSAAFDVVDTKVGLDLGEAIYASQQAAGAQAGAAGAQGPGAGGAGAGSAKGDENVVDAEYTEVKDKKTG